MSDLSIMLAIDAMDAGDIRAFTTMTAEPSIGLSIRADIRNGSTLIGLCGYGETFSEALNDLWRRMTELDSSDQYIVIRAGTDQRRAVRWNGRGFKPHYEADRPAGAQGAEA